MSQYSDAEAGRAGGCYSVCGPSPLRVSVICLLVISFWALLVLILHLDKKVASVQESLATTEQLLVTMEDSVTLFRQTCVRCLFQIGTIGLSKYSDFVAQRRHLMPIIFRFLAAKAARNKS